MYARLLSCMSTRIDVIGEYIQNTILGALLPAGLSSGGLLGASPREELLVSEYGPNFNRDHRPFIISSTLAFVAYCTRSFAETLGLNAFGEVPAQG